jgi:hypothetical protein
VIESANFCPFGVDAQQGMLLNFTLCRLYHFSTKGNRFFALGCRKAYAPQSLLVDTPGIDAGTYLVHQYDEVNVNRTTTSSSALNHSSI